MKRQKDLEKKKRKQIKLSLFKSLKNKKRKMNLKPNQQCCNQEALKENQKKK